MSKKIEAIIFDLDNVMYDEKTYVFKAFEAVAKLLAGKIKLKRKVIVSHLIRDFRKTSSMYPRLFNDILEQYFGYCDKKLLDQVLRVYAQVKPRLKLYPGAEHVLKNLQKKYKLGLLTNGRIDIQKNKVKLLQIAKYFAAIVYAREFAEKPSPVAYRALLKKLKIYPDRALTVEDNPFTDFKGAKKLGIKTVRVLTGEFKNVAANKSYQPDFIIKKLPDLLKIIKR